jgi:hypothetical protein
VFHVVPSLKIQHPLLNRSQHNKPFRWEAWPVFQRAEEGFRQDVVCDTAQYGCHLPRTIAHPLIKSMKKKWKKLALKLNGDGIRDAWLTLKPG